MTLRTLLLTFFYLSAVQCLGNITDLWVRQETPTLASFGQIYFTDSLYGWACGDSGVIVSTSNSGMTWNVQNTGIDYRIDDIFFLNRRLGWAVANNIFYTGTAILSTTNGGINWTFYIYPDTTLIFNIIYFLDSLNGWLGGYSQLFLQTTNGGFNWITRQIDSAGCLPVPTRNLAFYSSQYAFGCGGHFDVSGHILRTIDAGMTWTPICISPEPIYKLVIFDSLNIIGGGGDFEYGTSVVKTTNGGVNWDYGTLSFFGTGYSLAFRTRSEGWMPLGFSPNWAYTLDSGNTWAQMVTTDSLLVYDVTFTDPYHGWACGSNGSVLRHNSELIGIENYGKELIPQKPNLFQNYPNPFNPVTTIEFSLPKISRVEIALYDVLGREIRTLMNEIRKEGSHKFKFSSQGLSSGVYFYRLTAGHYRETKKLIILK